MKKPFWARYQAPEDDGGGSGGESNAPAPRVKKTAAQLNAERNAERLARIEEIGSEVDGRRAHEMNDVDGESVTGRFQDGAFDDSPEAREERAAQEEAEAEQALREQTEAAEHAEAETRGEARRLQAEGAPERTEARTEATETDTETSTDTADEKLINGERHYLQVINGQERWMTLKQIRDLASKSAAADETLQRATDALQRASTAALTPKEEPAEDLTDEDLENIVLSASTGDTEAVKKLVSAIKRKPSEVTPSDVSRQITQHLQTERAIDEGKRAADDILSNRSLEPLFRMKLAELGKKEPTLLIQTAYERIAKEMRVEFAPMLKKPGQPATKVERKREIVNPPQTAGRQPQAARDDVEEPMSAQIDRIAKGRGQERAYRMGRR